jgi:hypothetical protein
VEEKKTLQNKYGNKSILPDNQEIEKDKTTINHSFSYESLHVNPTRYGHTTLNKTKTFGILPNMSKI